MLFKPDEQKSYADIHEPLLTTEQRSIFTTLSLMPVRKNIPQPFMVDALAGTGKAFTEKVIAARVRGEGKLVLIVASAGIAALQLPGGF